MLEVHDRQHKLTVASGEGWVRTWTTALTTRLGSAINSTTSILLNDLLFIISYRVLNNIYQNISSVATVFRPSAERMLRVPCCDELQQL